MKRVILVAALAGAIMAAWGSLRQDNSGKQTIKTEKKELRKSPCDKY